VDNRRFLPLFAVAVPATLALGHFAFGGPAVLLVGVAAMLFLVSRFDNHTGSCLLVTIILLATIGILLSLLMLTARLGVH
jgi:hypothetical protein